MSGEEIGEIRLQGPGEREYFLDGGREYCTLESLEYFLEVLKRTGMRGKLRLTMDGFRKRLKPNPSPEDLDEGVKGLFEVERRSLPLGVLEVREGRIFLGDFELQRRELETWIGACWWGFWELTPERARELAERIASRRKEVEEKSLQTLRSVIGEELTERLLVEGKIPVKTVDGREYLLTRNGEVLSPDGRERFCVLVEGGERLPTYDLVLAKYLTIRDRPESISTLRRREWRNLRRLRRLVHELDMELFHLGAEEGGFLDLLNP